MENEVQTKIITVSIVCLGLFLSNKNFKLLKANHLDSYISSVPIEEKIDRCVSNS